MIRMRSRRRLARSFRHLGRRFQIRRKNAQSPFEQQFIAAEEEEDDGGRIRERKGENRRSFLCVVIPARSRMAIKQSEGLEVVVLVAI